MKAKTALVFLVRRGRAGGASRPSGQVARGPYYFIGPRPFREARLRSYIIREHRRGRPLSEILADPYLRRYGSDSLIRTVLMGPETIAALS